MQKLLVKVLNRLGLLKHLILTASIKFNGKTVKIPLIGGLGIEYLHLSEPWMTKMLQKLKKKYAVDFVDIGVNLGQTMVKVHSVFDSISYVGFEPNSSCINYVKEIIKVNKLRNFHIIPVGISNTSEVLKLNFFSNDDNDSSASILADFRPDQEIKRFNYVPVFNQQYIGDFLPVRKDAIVKIDVEGAELEVLQGLSDWVIQFKPVILVEILPVYKAENTYRLERQQKLEQLLLEWNYAIFRIGKADELSLLPLESIGIHSSVDDSDYLLCPADQKDSITKLF